MSWWHRKIRERAVQLDVQLDNDHSITLTTDLARPSAKMMWTHTVGPTVRCEGSGKRGIPRARESVTYRQCPLCRYAVQIGWGKRMVEHEREARGKERDG